MVVPRIGKAPTLVMPAPNSPKARACDRPLADVLPGDSYNPFRRKFQPAPLRTLRGNASAAARSLDRPLAAFPAAQRLPAGPPLEARSSAASSVRSAPSRSFSNSNTAPSTFPSTSPTKAERCVSKKVEKSLSSQKKVITVAGAKKFSPQKVVPTPTPKLPSALVPKATVTPETSAVAVKSIEAHPSPGRRSSYCSCTHPTPPTVVEITAQPAKSLSRRKVVNNKSTDSIVSSLTVESLSPTKRVRSAPKTSRKSRSHPQILAPKLPDWDDTREQDRLRVQELERKLSEIEASKARELEEIRAQTLRQKKMLAEKVRSSARDMAQDDRKLEDNRRVVETLRAENEKIRIRNREIRVNCNNLRTNNDRLEQTLKSNQDYHERLHDHQQRTELSHEKLQKMCKEYERQVEELQKEVDTETDLARYERFHRGLLEKLYLDVLPKLRKAGEAELCQEMRRSLTLLRSKDNGWTKPIHTFHEVGSSASDTESESSESEAEPRRCRYKL